MKDNEFTFEQEVGGVVNCFQKLLSSWWRTTEQIRCYQLALLWIAFKNYYLRDEGQHQHLSRCSCRCCELLSKIIIFVMKDNSKTRVLVFICVVNCFQKLLSSWWRTTNLIYGLPKDKLWIAFKNYYLRDEGQRRAFSLSDNYSCELLSKIIIFVMKDNRFPILWMFTAVVNCFQKLLSSWWRTTGFRFFECLPLLWIAFKNYYLRDEGQRKTIYNLIIWCCELLSKIIIFVMKDNSDTLQGVVIIVVNCFQKLLSSWWRTTKQLFISLTTLLWIAFKNYYLRDEGQLSQNNFRLLSSCELLSKIIIFVMKDNHKTFVPTIHMLWIAFKNYYLRDEGQPAIERGGVERGCELLSKIIIFVMKDNMIKRFAKLSPVVNCFQKLLSSWWRTTSRWRFNGWW